MKLFLLPCFLNNSPDLQLQEKFLFSVARFPVEKTALSKKKYQMFESINGMLYRVI